MLVDTHAHLNDERYGGAADIIADMRAAGLEKIVTVGYDLASSEINLRLAEANDDVYFTCGFHPSETANMTEAALTRLLELSRHPKCVAIGEIGLDYYYDDTDRETQKRALLRQLELVADAKLPAVFHVRDAYGDFREIVRANLSKLTDGAVLHCFSGSKETAEEYSKQGFYVSFSGAITFKNNVKAAEIVRAVPSNRLLVETDCPYLTPVPYRGKTNLPAYVRFTAEKVAEFRGETLAAVEQYTTDNAYAFYKKMKR